VTLSVAAFRKLGPGCGDAPKKHTPPITYIRTDGHDRPEVRLDGEAAFPAVHLYERVDGARGNPFPQAIHEGRR
jgi:hypothetical protein